MLTASRRCLVSRPASIIRDRVSESAHSKKLRIASSASLCQAQKVSAALVRWVIAVSVAPSGLGTS
jgi:hypothetical protein